MKRFLAPLTAFVLIATGYSLYAGGWLQSPSAGRVTPQLETLDRFASEAALHHRSGQPRHWRAMLMVR